MIKNKHIINSLPLLAAALGRKYGVEVVIGADNACTDGRTIYLPALPQDCDAILLGLVRGFIDHESAHIRETDFDIIKSGNLTPLEKHIWNILEDWRVENRISAVFPGCKQNLIWLIRYLFIEDAPAKPENPENADATRILDWMLLTVRSWDVPELISQCGTLAAGVEKAYPGLIGKLSPILNSVPARCKDSQDCLAVARKLIGLLEKQLQDQMGPEPESRSQQKSSETGNAKNKRKNALQQLQNLLDSQANELPMDISTIVAEKLGNAQENKRDGVIVATVRQKDLQSLDDKIQQEARTATNALRNRLQGMLQTEQLSRNRSAHQGRLDTHRLHRFFAGDARIFLGKTTRQGLNTAVHILLDTSGSMHGRQMELASSACFAVASALHVIPGINLAVTAFPGSPSSDSHTGFCTVAPILTHGQRMHGQFGIKACGCTPMDSALWWVLQELQFLPETRKIILLVTDGEPDNLESTRKAIAVAQNLGHEIYGIGIDHHGIQSLLPQHNQIIKNIQELPSAMFGMLQGALTHRSV